MSAARIRISTSISSSPLPHYHFLSILRYQAAYHQARQTTSDRSRTICPLTVSSGILTNPPKMVIATLDPRISAVAGPSNFWQLTLASIGPMTMLSTFAVHIWNVAFLLLRRSNDKLYALSHNSPMDFFNRSRLMADATVVADTYGSMKSSTSLLVSPGHLLFSPSKAPHSMVRLRHSASAEGDTDDSSPKVSDRLLRCCFRGNLLALEPSRESSKFFRSCSDLLTPKLRALTSSSLIISKIFPRMQNFCICSDLSPFKCLRNRFWLSNNRLLWLVSFSWPCTGA